jgi:hypothetical protein
MNRYTNIPRLLDEADVQFLQSFGLAEEARKLRRGRRRIYLSYVDALSRYAQRCQRERLLSGYDDFGEIVRWRIRVSGCLMGMRLCATLHRMHVQSTVAMAGSFLKQLDEALNPLPAPSAA